MSEKRLGIIVLICIILLALAGCRRPAVSEPPEDTPGGEQSTELEPEPEPGTEPETTPKPERTTLGGVSLGDNSARVRLMLGNNYSEEIFPDDTYYGQGVRVWSYPKGITAIFGLDSDKAIHLEAESSACATNLDVRVGDSAAAVLAKYRAIYEEYQGMYSDGPIPGWFLVENGGLLIFDCDPDDGTLANTTVGEAAAVEAIVLARARDFD